MNRASKRIRVDESVSERRQRVRAALLHVLTPDVVSVVLPYAYPFYLADAHFNNETLCFLYLFVPVFWGKHSKLLAVRQRFSGPNGRLSRATIWQEITKTFAHSYVNKVRTFHQEALLDCLLQPEIPNVNVPRSRLYLLHEGQRADIVLAKHFLYAQADHRHNKRHGADCDCNDYCLPPAIELIGMFRGLRVIIQFVRRWKETHRYVNNNNNHCVVM